MEFFGLIGETLSHSLSPAIHGKIFALSGIAGAYKLFEIPKDKIDGYAQALRLLQIKGVSVTMPYKQTVINGLDELSPEAARIGAVNTIANNNGTLRGYNTDYFGFKSMLLRNEIDTAEKMVAVLGTGGAAQAVLTALQDLGTEKIYCVTRSRQAISNMRQGIEYIEYEQINKMKGYAIINTTPVGMYPNVGASPLSEEVISHFDCVVDLIYNPIETEFLNLGKTLGKKTCGGLEMLVGQAIKAQEIWHNRTFDENMFNHVLDSVKQLL